MGHVERDWLAVAVACTCLAIVWFVPAALQHYAREASVRRWGEPGRATPHSTCLSGPCTVLAVAACGGVAFSYNVYVVLVRPLLGW